LFKVDEIYDTEKSYLKDLKVIKEIYLDDENTELSKSDIKALFANLPDVIATSTRLKADLHENSIGLVFLENSISIEDVYINYCRFSEHAVVKLNDFSGPDCPTNIKEYLLVNCGSKLYRNVRGNWQEGQLRGIYHLW
jgi:hypothetical protein